MRFRLSKRVLRFSLALAILVPCKAVANTDIALIHGNTYNLSTTDCALCHTSEPAAKSNLNAYGDRLDVRLDANIANRTNAEITAAIEAAEIDNANGNGFASEITNGLSRTISVTAGSTTLSFDAGRIRSGSTASISNHRAPFKFGYSYTKIGNSLRINVNLSPQQRGNVRRSGGHPVRFQFEPLNNASFFPTGEGNNEALELNEFLLSFENEKPIAVADTFDGKEIDGTVTGNVITQTVAGELGDRDIDGDAFTAQVVSPPVSGTLDLEPNGDFTYQIPDPLPPNPVTFTYRLVETDTGVTSDTVTVSMIIEATPNRPPVAVDDAFATDEDTPLSGDLTAANPTTADSDPDGDTLMVSLVNGPLTGTLTPTIVGGQWLGAFDYVPAENETGDVAFTYAVFDGEFTETATATISIAPVNDAPIAVDDTFSGNEADGTVTGNVITQAAAGSQGDRDVEGDDFTAELVTPPATGTLVLNPDGSFTYTIPNPLPPSPVTFDYRLRETGSNLTSNTATASLTITPAAANQRPVAADDAFATDEDTPFSGNLLDANPTTADSDPDGDPLQVELALVASPAKGTLTPTLVGGLWLGEFEYTPGDDETGTDTFTYNLSDGSLTDAATVTITIDAVNDPPIAVADSFNGNAADGTITGNVITRSTAGQPRDRDVENDAFTAMLVSAPAVGTLTLQPTGDFVYEIPSPVPAGPVTFEYKLAETASGLESNTALVTLTVGAAANLPPDAVDDAFTTPEDTPFTGDLLAANPTTADSDPNGDPLSVRLALVSSPQKGSLSPTLVGGQWLGGFEYTPFADESGTDSFTYTLTDGSLTDTATATITITTANDAPLGMNAILATVNESQGVQTIDLLNERFVTDSDNPASALSVVDFAVSGDTVDFQRQDNIVTFDPAQFSELDVNESATFTFTYFVEDPDSQRTAAPVEITQTVIGLDNGLGRIAGQYADTLTERYNGHFLPSTIVNDSCHSCHLPGHVNVQVRSVDQCSTDVFNPYGFAICIDRDASAPPLTDLLRRLVSREPEFAPQLVSAPPLQIDDTAPTGTPVGTPLSANPGKTVQGTPSTIVDYAIVGGGGQLQDTDDSGQFTVDSNGQVMVAGALKPGVYTLDIRPINDAGQLDTSGNPRPGVRGFYPVDRSLLRFVTVTVNGAAPGAVDDDANVSAGTSTSIDVLANDAGGEVDALTLVQQPMNGTAAVNPDRTITYTPTGSFSGDDSFVYRSSGPGGESGDATVRLTVIPTGGAVAVPDKVSAVASQPTVIDVTANDLGNRPLTVAITVPPNQGTAEVVGGTQIRFTPPDGLSGTVQLRYRVSNALGGSETNVAIQSRAISGEALENGTDDPALKPIARALGDSCSAILAGGGAASVDQRDLLEVCNLIASDVSGGADIDDALDAIRNEELLAVQEIAMANGRSMRGAVFDRLRDARNGPRRRVDISGINVGMGDQSISAGDFQEIIDYLAQSGNAAGAVTSSAGAVNGFISGDVVFGERDDTRNESGYDLRSYSIVGGADYRVNDNVVIGGALGLSQSETEFSGNGGEIDARSYQLAIYGSVDNIATPGLRLDGMIAGGLNDYSSSRRINFTSGGTTIDRTATADFDGKHVNAVARLEYDLSKREQDAWLFETGIDRLGPWRVRLFTELDYLYAETDGYTERGAGGLSLRVGKQSFDSLIGNVGLNVGLPIQVEGGTVSPFIELSANHEFLDDRPSLSASFAAVDGAAANFTVTGDTRDSFFGRLAIGATGEIQDTDVKLEYETSIGRSEFTDHRLSLSVGRPLFGNDRLGLGGGLAISPGSDGEPDLEFSLDYDIKF